MSVDTEISDHIDLPPSLCDNPAHDWLPGLLGPPAEYCGQL